MSGAPLVIAGGGLAGGLLALHLLAHRPDVEFTLLERGPAPGGNHTWSFHGTDLTPEQHELVAPLVSHRWAGQSVRFPELERSLSSPYFSILSDRFAEVLAARLGPRLRLRTAVRDLHPDRAVLDGGEIVRGTVIDARGFRPHPQMAIRFQSFLGHELRLARPHGLTVPVIMDATTPQTDGYRFTYLLPFGEQTVLVEDTGYLDRDGIDRATLERRIADYAQDKGWTTQAVLRREAGVLPITLAGDIEAFWTAAEPVSRIGLAGGFFHPTTGYSLPDALRVAEVIGAQKDLSAPALYAALRRYAGERWREQGFYRALNRMLFLAGKPEQRWRVMQRFYRLPQPLIERFYAGRLTRADQVRILAGKPPVPVHQALSALFAHPTGP